MDQAFRTKLDGLYTARLRRLITSQEMWREFRALENVRAMRRLAGLRTR